jgi:hypothetical protein
LHQRICSLQNFLSASAGLACISAFIVLAFLYNVANITSASGDKFRLPVSKRLIKLWCVPTKAARLRLLNPVCLQKAAINNLSAMIFSLFSYTLQIGIDIHCMYINLLFTKDNDAKHGIKILGITLCDDNTSDAKISITTHSITSSDAKTSDANFFFDVLNRMKKCCGLDATRLLGMHLRTSKQMKDTFGVKKD